MGQVNAARWVGLTATPYRADELNGLITMQCGPIRYDFDSPLAATRELRIHHTDLEPESHETDGAGMQELHNEIAHDEQRNRQIAEVIVAELCDGRHCLALSNRTQHIHGLTDLVQEAGIQAPVIGLHGS